MVLDFLNDPEQVREDFQHYYGRNFMEEENQTDPNSLYDVLDQIEAFNIYYENEVETFAKIFFKAGDDFEKLQPILNEIAGRYENNLEEEDQHEFKSAAISFTKLYRFLSQIITFNDVELEKKYVFITALIKKLPYIKSKLPLDILNDVELDSYKIQHQFTSNLQLDCSDGEDTGMNTSGGGSIPEEEYDFLSKIIKVLNDTHGLELSEEDKVELSKVKESTYNNEDLMTYFNPENSKSNIKDKFDELLDKELLNLINSKLDFYNKMTEQKVNKMVKRVWFDELYKQKMNELR